MNQPFTHVALYSHHINQEITETLASLYSFLLAYGCQVVIEDKTAAALNQSLTPPIEALTVPIASLHQGRDLIISVGGDGNLLHAAQAAHTHDTPVLGINRGRLGFLTDIRPNEFGDKLAAILQGAYCIEPRFLLSAAIADHYQASALNDIIIRQGPVPHMLSFSLYLDDELICRERSDGLIIATPTGSTAYALSGGGPILHPQLETLVLLTMFSHTLSSRPLVIPGHATVRIAVAAENNNPALVRADGQDFVNIAPGEELIIKQHPKKLPLVHPLDYDYFATLRTKLRWGTN